MVSPPEQTGNDWPGMSINVDATPPLVTSPVLNGPGDRPGPTGTAFGCPRDFRGNSFVYTVISARARGLSVGVNMNPDQQCNFDCVYCEVNRSRLPPASRLEVSTMAVELEQTLESVNSGTIRQRLSYWNVPPELLELRHVALSGDGEPTLCPNFAEAVEAVIHLRARGRFPYFKLVLITNASGLARPNVEEALRLFTPRDEVWVKLDAGTPDYLHQVNRPDCTLEEMLERILNFARRRPVVIQSLFPALKGEGPPAVEVDAYIQQLRHLQERGARISLVQVYSATRPTVRPECGHLSLRTLSSIAQSVRAATGLAAEVF